MTEYDKVLSDCPHLKETSKLLINDFFDEREENTRRGYAYLIRTLDEKYGKDIFELTKENIADYVDSIDNKSGRTFNNYTGYLKALYKYYDAVNDSNLHSMVETICRKNVAYDKFGRKVPDKENIETVLYFLNEKHDMITFLPLLLAFKLGLTTGDIERIKNKQIIMRGGSFYIIIPKTGQLRERSVKIPDEYFQIIGKYKQQYGAAEEDSFFVNQYGKPMTARVMQKYLKKACEDAGVECFSLNDVRNLGIPLLMAAGESREQVSKMTGTGTGWYNKYDGLVKHYAGEYERKIDGIKELYPLVRAGKMTAERMNELLGIAPWEEDELIKKADIQTAEGVPLEQH